ncbi:hypothetical protein M501DRAFT_592761 [Patellaria atrata CBS 101060]|uniref:Uncharacterized protein n=1 Tax=Patellaria atrata CBS 101060 TaxID=1346257 RepID=A0A9P4S1I9_9PEZI|nr:hypothetical protein M501DRAFT_592761 [Patellaria atrata CBS 101060]
MLKLRITPGDYLRLLVSRFGTIQSNLIFFTFSVYSPLYRPRHQRPLQLLGDIIYFEYCDNLSPVCSDFCPSAIPVLLGFRAGIILCVGCVAP